MRALQQLMWFLASRQFKLEIYLFVLSARKPFFFVVEAFDKFRVREEALDL